MVRAPSCAIPPAVRELAQHTSVFEPIRDADPELAATQMAAHLDAVVPYHVRFGLS